MALDWLPILDEPSRPKLLGAEYQPHYAGNSRQIPAISAWLATYPNQIWRKTLPVACRPALFYPSNNAPALTVPTLAWKPSYPDFLLRRRSTALGGYSWVPFARATQLTQSPRYPDRISRQTVHPSRLPFLAMKLEAIPTSLSWQGSYPDRVWPRPHLSTDKQATFLFAPEPVADPPPPGLGYEIISAPLFLFPRASVPLPSQQVFGANLDPIPNPLPSTDFNSPPVYPDWTTAAPARRGAVTQTTAVLLPISSTAGNDLRWLPSYPAFHRRPVRLQPILSFQVSAILAIPITSHWRPRYPDRLARVSNVNDFIGFDPLSVASLLPDPPDCIEWTAEGYTRPALINEDITRAGFIEDDGTGAQLEGAKAC